jgi:uncharacterized protein YbjQ (UPF0145 family)
VFGLNKKDEPRSEIPILTIDTFPGREYEYIGTLMSECFYPHATKPARMADIMKIVQDDAHKLGADAIIGFRLLQYGVSVIYGYGTAIKFK